MSALLLIAMDMKEDTTDRGRRQATMSPMMPEMQPIYSRSADVFEPGELYSLDGNGLGPTMKRSGPHKISVLGASVLVSRWSNTGLSHCQAIYSSRYAEDDFQSEYV
jgi:hypothetical protein